MRAIAMMVMAVPLAAAPSLAAAAAAPKVPAVVVGPDAAATAPRVAAPVAEVTVFSDRARVRRRGHLTLAAGPSLVRLPDLPGAAFLDTVRVAVSAGRVLRVEATPVQRERLAIEQAVKLLDELDAANDAAAALADRAAADEWEVELLGRLSPAAPVPEDKREGRKGLLLDVASWGKALDFVSQRGGTARERLAALADERRALEARRARLRADIAALDRGGFSDRGVQVIAVLDGGASAGADVTLEYFVPGARWKPTYDLHFASARGEVRLETAAVVEQATGEDWEQAALSFSTARPGRGIDLPELLTWTLGERSDFIPSLRARATPAAEPPPARVVEADATGGRALEATLVRERLARALAADGEYDLRKALPAERPLSIAAGRMQAEAAAAPAPPPPMPTPMSAPAATMVSAQDDSDEESESARPRSYRKRARVWNEESASPLADAPAIRRMSGSSGASYTPVALALNDAVAAGRAPALSDPFLPAVSAGGLDYVHRAPTPATIASSGRQVRVPLGSQLFRAAVYHEATPGLATTAFLRARVRNDGKRPLLRGPVVIFGDGELVGQGEIQTTGPSGDIELPLGADQDLRLLRQVVPSTRTTGLIMKSEETTYDVQIQVGNYKKQAVSLEVIDQVPRSRNGKVTVELLGTDPAPRAPADADGVLRFRLDVPAGATRVVKVRYKITRPKDWVLFQ